MDASGRSNKDDVLVALLQECGCNERHFNTLQSEYRKLASGWLLAALGAIGYVMISPRACLHRAALAELAAAGASVGVFVLWLLDYFVYHRLLEATFLAATAVEAELDSENVHKAVSNRISTRSVCIATAAFYLGAGWAPPVAAVLALYATTCSLASAVCLAVPGVLTFVGRVCLIVCGAGKPDRAG